METQHAERALSRGVYFSGHSLTITQVAPDSSFSGQPKSLVSVFVDQPHLRTAPKKVSELLI